MSHMIAEQDERSATRIRKPTLKDVARIAGVSVWTASTAFSHPEKLKKETLEKILSTAGALHYIRNGAAASLVSKRTRTIAVTVPTINNPLYSDVLACIQKVLVEQDYLMFIGSHEFEYEREFEVVRSLVERGVDGFIILGSSHEPRTYDLLRSRNVPYVLALSFDASGEHHTVGISNFDASYRMADMVAGMGHRRVALCGGFHQNNERAREREEGAVAALVKYGVKVPKRWRFQRELTMDAGREVFRKIWAGKTRPTALICSTDVQALGALDEARKHGVAVPQDISVTGFDDIEFASISSPPLTTIQTPVAVIARRSTSYLLDLIGSKEQMRAELLDTSVVVRESLAPPAT